MKPILFNTAMVRAILDGRKTVTRRVVKARNTEIIGRSQWAKGQYWFDVIKTMNGQKIATADKILPPYKPGDILYVRETWGYDKNNWLYKADFTPADLDRIASITKWLPSIHMPKKAARIFLRVTSVRVEQLHDMTAMSAMDEGFIDWCDFMDMWDSTIKKADMPLYGWDANPWVWVIGFERINLSGGE